MRDNLDAAEAAVRLGEGHRDAALVHLHSAVTNACAAMIEVTVQMEQMRICRITANALNAVDGGEEDE